MNKQMMVQGAFSASRILGHAIGKAMRDYLPLVGIACLLAYCVAITYFAYQVWEDDHALKHENAYLHEHCMVFGEQGDVMVPIEVLEGDYNWTIQ